VFTFNTNSSVLSDHLALRVVYVANILLAGSIAIQSIQSISSAERAARTVFSSAYGATEVMRLVGCLWLAIAVLSALGIVQPLAFAPVLLLQLIYKSCWLFSVALPAHLRGASYPAPMATCFVLWVVALPFVMPWSHWAEP
jgi:hypothetical protein